MRKKIAMMLFCLLAVSTTKAQYLNDSPFTEGKYYASLSASGFDLSYHKGAEWHLNLSAKGGYIVADNLMLLGNFGYDNATYEHSAFVLGAGARYYVEDNGFYGGLLLNYAHMEGVDDFKPEVHVGYSYFLTGKLTVEPEVYYEQSFKDNNYSGFGVRIGFGLYF